MSGAARAWTRALGGAAVWTLASCAAPPLALYTLQTAQEPPPPAPSARPLVVIAVARVAVPDELDNEDILVRSGSALHRSALGRWSSRLSIEVTERITARLGERRPDALVTSAPQAQTPSYRLIIDISRLDVDAKGLATLQADWSVVPRDPNAPARRDRAEVSIERSAATDPEIVNLMDAAIDQLSQTIAADGLGGEPRPIHD